MKLFIPQIDLLLDFSGESCCSLVIEQPELMYQLLCDLNNQMQGVEGKVILSEENHELSIAHSLELLTQFVPFEMNRKNLQNKAITQLCNRAVDEEHYMKSKELLGAWEQYLLELSLDIKGNVLFPKITEEALIRAAGPVFDEDYGNLGEKLLDYFELVREYDKEKLFILVNVRSYLSGVEIDKLMEGILVREIQVLFLDGREFPISRFERRKIIDADLCVVC